MKLNEQAIHDVIVNATALAMTFDRTQEVPKDSNRGATIDKIQRIFGLVGQQYCAMFAQYCYIKPLDWKGYIFPIGLTASSQTLRAEAIKAGCFETDFANLKRGDIVIWRKFKLWQGHVGIALTSLDQFNKFRTVEGNTQPNTKGDQREGGGIYIKERTANKLDFSIDNFYLTGFINMRKLLTLCNK